MSSFEVTAEGSSSRTVLMTVFHIECSAQFVSHSTVVPSYGLSILTLNSAQMIRGRKSL